MQKFFLFVAAFALFAVPGLARGSGAHSSGSHSSIAHAHSSVSRSSSARCSTCARDSHGKITRSPKAKHEFQRSNPCPSTGKTSGACPGFVVDHVVPLKRGGADAPGNMQWQTKGEAKVKDKVE